MNFKTTYEIFQKDKNISLSDRDTPSDSHVAHDHASVDPEDDFRSMLTRLRHGPSLRCMHVHLHGRRCATTPPDRSNPPRKRRYGPRHNLPRSFVSTTSTTKSFRPPRIPRVSPFPMIPTQMMSKIRCKQQIFLLLLLEEPLWLIQLHPLPRHQVLLHLLLFMNLAHDYKKVFDTPKIYRWHYSLWNVCSCRSTTSEALEDDRWCKAMPEQYNTLMDNKT
jgi:hypothetical protein